jgi:hypothetical protein
MPLFIENRKESLQQLNLRVLNNQHVNTMLMRRFPNIFLCANHFLIFSNADPLDED